MLAYECLNTVNKLLDALEGKIELTQKEKGTYGYYNNTWTGKKYYSRYSVKNYINLTGTDRSQVTKTMLKEMKKFLEKAIKFGFIGDVKFRIGYDNGMYASTRVTQEGYDEGQLILYHNFGSERKYWQLRTGRKIIGEDCTKEKEIKELIEKYNKGEIIG